MKKAMYVCIVVIAVLAATTAVFAADSGISISIANTNNVQANGGWANQEQQQLKWLYQSLGLPKELGGAFADIEKVKGELAGCIKLGYENLSRRGELVYLYKKVYEITEDTRYIELALSHAQIAEQNYQKGFDIKQNQSKANQTMRQAYRYWAFCIWKLHGDAAAQKFADAKGIKVF